MKACRSGGFVAIVMAVMITGCSVALWAQQGAPPAKNPFAAADEKILVEVHDHNEIMSQPGISFGHDRAAIDGLGEFEEGE